MSHYNSMNSPIRFEFNPDDLCRPISRIVCNSFHLCEFIHIMNFLISKYETKYKLNMLVHVNSIKVNTHK